MCHKKQHTLKSIVEQNNKQNKYILFFIHLQRITKFSSSNHQQILHGAIHFIILFFVFKNFIFFLCVIKHETCSIHFANPKFGYFTTFLLQIFVQFFIDLQHITNSIPIIFLLSEFFTVKH